MKMKELTGFVYFLVLVACVIMGPFGVAFGGGGGPGLDPRWQTRPQCNAVGALDLIPTGQIVEGEFEVQPNESPNRTENTWYKVIVKMKLGKSIERRYWFYAGKYCDTEKTKQVCDCDPVDDWQKKLYKHEPCLVDLQVYFALPSLPVLTEVVRTDCDPNTDWAKGTFKIKFPTLQ